jgi:ketosteroid isomerase-like protein
VHESTQLLVRVVLGVMIIVYGSVMTATAQADKPPSAQGIMTEAGSDLAKGIDAARFTFGDAYVKGDAKTLSLLYHPNAVFAGTLHPYWLEGRDNISRLWTFYFSAYKDARIHFWSSSLRIIAPNAAVAQHATATMAMPDGTGRVHNIHMRLTIVWVRVPEYSVGSQSVQWQIAHMHGSEAPLFR